MARQGIDTEKSPKRPHIDNRCVAAPYFIKTLARTRKNPHNHELPDNKSDQTSSIVTRRSGTQT